jgi:hypothetical protein
MTEGRERVQIGTPLSKLKAKYRKWSFRDLGFRALDFPSCFSSLIKPKVGDRSKYVQGNHSLMS